MDQSKTDEEINPQLSLLAQFDDLCRFSDNLVRSSDEHKSILDLIKAVESNRKGWLSTKKELKQSEKQNQNLISTVSLLQTNIKRLHKKKVNLRNQTIRLRNQLNSLKKLIEEKHFCCCGRIQRQLLTDFDADINVINEELESEYEDCTSLEESEEDYRENFSYYSENLGSMELLFAQLLTNQ